MKVQEAYDLLSYQDQRRNLTVYAGGAQNRDIASIQESTDKEEVVIILADIDQEESQHKELLDAWANTRLPLPFDEATPPELMTTLDIQDQLQPMDTIPLPFINAYMKANAYGLTTVQDGTIRWMVWRKPASPSDL